MADRSCLPDRVLRKPSSELAESFIRFRDAVLAKGDGGWIAPGTAIALTDVDAYIEAAGAWSVGKDVPNGWVPSSIYWILESGEIVGELVVRHSLTEHLREIGGHIGYLTHPAYRNRGIGTFALREGLKLLADMGVKEALVTCLDENTASVRVIEKCGGLRVNDAANGPKRRRYLFAL